MTTSDLLPQPLAFATSYRRITLIALERVWGLTRYCEGCGASTYNVAMWRRGASVEIAEVCASCASEAGMMID